MNLERLVKLISLVNKLIDNFLNPHFWGDYLSNLTCLSAQSAVIFRSKILHAIIAWYIQHLAAKYMDSFYGIHFMHLVEKCSRSILLEKLGETYN